MAFRSKLKDNVSKDSHLSKFVSSFVAESSVRYKYDSVFHGYAATLRDKDLDLVRKSKDVEYIEEDGIATIEYLYISFTFHSALHFHSYDCSSPGDASLASKRSAIETLSNRATCGENVDVYVIDTVSILR